MERINIMVSYTTKQSPYEVKAVLNNLTLLDIIQDFYPLPLLNVTARAL